jgi:CHAD domain-containing protein
LDRLGERHDALLLCYDEEVLHQFRVTLRRMRSLLLHHDSKRARRLRRALGKLAATTGAARDWDTLVIRARASLRAEQFALVRSWLLERQEASHRPVLAMLCSDRWRDTCKDAKKFNRRHGKSLIIEASSGADLVAAKQRVSLAWCAAQAEHDNRDWHKLRVAIKDLRYCLENLPGESRDGILAATLQHCKRLQETLGIWHDTVVHLRMVREHIESLDPAAEQELREVLQTWCRRMEGEARDYLDRTVSDLRGRESLLLH